MNIGDLDFKMLSVFQALLELGQVSAAADQLGVGQSNVSRSLAKLRTHFGDPLFVRTQRGMEPTPRAVQISTSVNDMLRIYQNTLSGSAEFDPASSHRIFHIAGSEVGHVLGISRLGKEIFEVAPHVQLHAVPLGINTLAKELESDTDLAFGPFPKLYAGIHERTVYAEHYVCMVRRDHPDITADMSMNDFRRAQHIVVSGRRWGHTHEQIESQIVRAIPEDNIRIVTHNFLTAALLAASSDCVVTVPSGTAQALAEHSSLRVLKPPFELPAFDVKLYWHERFHQDPAHIWLRNLIYSLFENVTNILEQEVV
ncbi:MAG: LysR family transcriptional regulator [Halioglobus sp.]